MLTRRSFVAGTGMAVAAQALPLPAFSQEFNRPVRLMVGYPAGGGVDLIARMLTDPLKTAFNQAFVVENRTGAAATIAAQTVAQAGPDGHAILVAASGEVAINHHLFKGKMQYDPLKDLVPIALAGIVPCVVVVNSKTDVKTPADLIAYAKANKGKLSFSSSGVGNPQHLAGELMNKMAGTDVLHVPYRGSAPAVADVAGGQVTMSFSSLAAALPLIQDGRIRAVAVTSKDRMPQLPDVAPLSDGPGLAGYELLNWFAVFAPAGTPEPLLNKLSAECQKVLYDPAVVAKLDVQGIVSRKMNLAELKTFHREEAEKFGKIIQDANITLQAN